MATTVKALFDPFTAPDRTTKLFVLPGWRGKVSRALLQHVPWLVCGEVVFVARAVDGAS